MDEACAVIAGQGCVVVLQQFDNGVPPLACVVDHVVATHVHIELHPLHLLRQVQDICMEYGKERFEVKWTYLNYDYLLY